MDRSRGRDPGRSEKLAGHTISCPVVGPLDVTAYTKKKGRLRCHKRPKSREETPKEGSDSGGATA
jgi:hypothetical protein